MRGDADCLDVMVFSGGYFTDQFENTANFDSHYATTGPEIWRQTNGTVDAFVMAAGGSLLIPFLGALRWVIDIVL